MVQITARVPEANWRGPWTKWPAQLRRSRADLIRQMIEQYVEDFGDLTVERGAAKGPLTRFWTGTRSGATFSQSGLRAASPWNWRPSLLKIGRA